MARKRVSQPRHALVVDMDIDISMRDGSGSAPYTHYSADYNSGSNTVFAGGKQASYLLLPVIPVR